MENGAFSDADFAKDFGGKVVLFCHIMTKIEGHPLDNLLSKKSDRVAFPTMVYLDSEGGVLAKHAGARTAPAFNKTLAAIDAWQAAKAKVDAGDAAAQADYLIASLELGKLGYGEAKAMRKKLGDGLDPKQAAKIDGLLVGLEFDVVMKAARGTAAMRRLGRRQYMNKLRELQKKRDADILAMAEAGKFPGGQFEGMFLYYAMLAADKAGKTELLSGLVKRAKRTGDRRLRSVIDRMEKRLERK